MGWQSKTLAEVTELITDGSHNPPPAQDEGVPMLSARNISSAGIDLNAGFRLVSEKDFLEEVRRADPQPGDVLLTIVGTIGRTTIVSEHHLPFCLQRSVALLRPKDDLHPEYLNYWIQAPRLQRFFALNARGTAQKGVYLKTLKAAPVDYPDPEEQKRICAELDNSLSRANACIRQLESVQAKLKQARASILKAAVEGRLVETKNATELSINQANPSHGQCIPSHWQMRSIRDLFDQRLGKMLDKAKNSGDLTPYLRNANVRWQSFDLNDLKLMRISRKEIQETSVKHGDIVVCEGGEPGRCAVWKSHQNVVIQRHCIGCARGSRLIQYFFLINLKMRSAEGESSTYIPAQRSST
jgi:restriction endonuclease S subunit